MGLLAVGCRAVSPMPSGEVSAPAFHTRGGELLRDGKPVALRGVNTMHIFNGDPADLLKWRGIEISREFVCNLKCAPLEPGTSYYDEAHKWTLHSLQALATSNSQRGIVTLFCPFNWDGNDKTTGFCGATPSKTEYYADYKKRMQDWARQFKGQPYVWIELWNEPYARLKSPADDALWLSATADMVDNLRAAGWDGIIALSGAAWGQDETILERMGPELLRDRQDIVFDIHAYEQWLAHPQTMAARFAALRAKRLPFFIGEFGPANGKTSYDTKPLLDVARSNQISTLAWIYTAPNPGDHGQDFLLAHDYQPNDLNNFNWGSTFKAFLAEPH
jgi:mannan endo-1,4-beta-mannosidase